MTAPGLASPAFAAFFRQPIPGAQPVARLPESVATALGATSPTMRLSVWTAAKQAERHSDVTPRDYQRLQHVLDVGAVFQSAERPGVLGGFVAEDSCWWCAVIKRTTDGRETYPVSYTRARRHQVEQGRRMLKRVGGV